MVPCLVFTAPPPYGMGGGPPYPRTTRHIHRGGGIHRHMHIHKNIPVVPHKAVAEVSKIGNL